jgi:hypothetical protein
MHAASERKVKRELKKKKKCFINPHTHARTLAHLHQHVFFFFGSLDNARTHTGTSGLLHHNLTGIVETAVRASYSQVCTSVCGLKVLVYVALRN